MQYRPEIDGLRAVAVLPVILFHAGFEWFSGGFVGVDVFFVISGYLITTIIINEMEDSKFSILKFYERRARRILPALFFLMMLSTPLAIYSLTPYSLKEFGQSLLSTSTFSSNILFFLKSGYFETASEFKPLIHTWSLAVEEQFYILFPIFLMLTASWKRQFMFYTLIFLFLSSLALAHWGTAHSRSESFISASFFLLPMRGWELLLGVAAAFYLQNPKKNHTHIFNQLLSGLGFALITISIFKYDEQTPFPSIYTLAPTLGTLLIILTATKDTLIYKILSNKTIVFLGLISYSTYLWHQPIFVFSRQLILGEISQHFYLFLSLISILMGYLSWRWIEKPFRDRQRFSQETIFSLSVLFIMLFSLIGFGIHKTDGLKNQLEEFYTNKGVPLLVNVPEERKLIQAFQKEETLLPPGRIFTCEKNCRKLLVLGDSFGEDAYRSLVTTSSPHNEVRYVNIDDQCLYKIKTLDHLTDSTICHSNEVLESLLMNADTIVLSSNWESSSLESVYEFINLLKNSFNHKIFIVGSIVFAPLSSISIKLVRNGYEKKDLPKVLYSTQRWDLLEVNRKLKGFSQLQEGVTWIDKSRFFCNNNLLECYLFNKEGMPRIWDHGHLTSREYPPFGRYLFKQIVIE